MLGASWSVATFLIVPVMLVEHAGPAAAIERSVALLRQSWGEQIGARLGLGSVQVVLIVPGIVLVYKGLLGSVGEARIPWLVAAAVYLSAVALLFATLGQILRAAVYIYATTGELPAGFEDAGLDGNAGL